MAGSFMKIKRIVIPFVTLVVMTSQLAGCATMTGDEMLKSINESPKASIEYAVPDTGQQILDTDSTQLTSDSDSKTDLISNQEKQELSEDELLEYFQTVYDVHLEIHTATTPEGIIQEELDFLVSLVESDGKTLLSGYEAQYRAWRPERLPADMQTQQNQKGQEQQNNQQSSGQQTQGQQQQQGQTQTSQPSGSTYDPYDGYGSYNAMIDAACKKYPELSREEIMQRIPDSAGIHVDEEAAQQWAQEGLLNNGG